MNRILKFKINLQESARAAAFLICALAVVATSHAQSGTKNNPYPQSQGNGFAPAAQSPASADWNWPSQAVPHSFPDSQTFQTNSPQPNSPQLGSNNSISPANFELEFPDAELEAQPMGDVERLTSNIKQVGSDIKQKINGWMGDSNSVEDDGASHPWMKKIGSLFKGDQLNKTLGSLAVVIGGYFGFVWLTRKFNPGGSSALPSEVVEVMGRTPFGPQQNLQLVRLGSKLLLLLNGPDGTHPIGEVSDPSEVEYLASLCPGHKNGTRSTSRSGNSDSGSAASAIQRASKTLVPRRRNEVDSVAEQAPDSADFQDVISQLQNVLSRNSGSNRSSRSRNSFEA